MVTVQGGKVLVQPASDGDYLVLCSGIGEDISYRGLALREGNPDAPLPPEASYRDLIALLGQLDADSMAQASLAVQTLRWDRENRFCGSCGTPACYNAVEHAKICPACGQRKYPAQYPVVIVAVRRAGKVLLAHNRNFPEGLYSVVAGFVDLGETAEAAVAREVLEETGLCIGAPQYVGSQNWAPSSSLMLGYLADWAGRDIVVDGGEITHADWFAPDSLPTFLPPVGTISRQLIDLACERIRATRD